MKLTIEQIAAYKHSDKHRVFNLKCRDVNGNLVQKIYVGDMSKSTTMTSTRVDNYGCMLYTAEGQSAPGLIRALYDTSHTPTQIAQYNKSTASRTGRASDFHTVYGQYATGLSSVCTYAGQLYGLSEFTDFGRLVPNVQLDARLSADTSTPAYSTLTSYAAIFSPTSVQMYKPLSSTDATSGVRAESYSQYLSSDTDTRCAEVLDRNSPGVTNVYGIHHNFIFELQDKIYNPYVDGVLVCNTYKLKNYLNSQYDLCASFELVDGKRVYSFNNFREYLMIDSCADTLYLTYRDNMAYSGTLQSGSSSLTASAQAKPASDESAPKVYNFEHVETVAAVKRMYNLHGKKSNLYSLNINNELINNISTTSEAGQRIKRNIQTEVTNVMRDIVKKICPANTQLYSVYFN